jgi:hypothetical protein
MLSSFFRAGILLVVTLLTSRLGAAQNAERGFGGPRSHRFRQHPSGLH